jgi:hypothetical protein
MRSLRRRAFLAVPALLLAAALGLYALGSRADAEPRLAATESDGFVCHLVRPPGEGVYAHCSRVLPFPTEHVREVVTDYLHFGDVCPYLKAERIDFEPDGGCAVVGTIGNGFGGRLPFAAELKAEQTLDQFLARWDRPVGDTTVNRGFWRLTRLAAGRCRLELAQEVEVRGVPTFFVRLQSLRRLPVVLGNVEKRLRGESEPRPW